MGVGLLGGKERPGRDADPHPLIVPRSRKSRAIPLIPLRDRTACTEPQCLYHGAFYLYLYLFSPYGPYRLYRASVPVQRCTLPLSIPLIPVWTVQPVQSLSACTTVHFNFTYTSTSPMDRTACTESQCLYNGALYLYLYLYSPYGPYSLYRASVPVQR